MTFLLSLLLCAAQDPAAAAAPPPPARPRDPFVFRCVLDGRPRMVTLALSDELWAAWDATHCSFAKAWKGGVKFDGAVYTTVHGPQPTSQGATYTEGLEGDVWMAAVKDQTVEARARWRGYRLEQGRCVLQYAIVLPDGREVQVEERPEFVRPEDLFTAEERDDFVLRPGVPGLVRRYSAPLIPDDVKLALHARTDAPRGRFIDAGGAMGEQLIDVKDAQGQVTATQIHSYLLLTPQKPVNTLIQFFEPIPEPPAPGSQKDAARPEGGR